MKHLPMSRRIAVLLLSLVLILMSHAVLAEEEPALTLTFSMKSGFYSRPAELVITCSNEEADIYYTTDGSLPDDSDLYFDEYIELDMTTEKEDVISHYAGTESGEDFMPLQDFPSAHVIRAVAMLEDGTCSEVVSGTYFIGYDRKELYGDALIVSLMMEEDDLFDYQTGIYVLGAIHEAWAAEQAGSFENWEAQGNFTQHGREWERPVTVDFMPAQGEGFTQAMGVRIKGGASRGYKHKSLRLIAREAYGEKKVKYPVFEDNICEQDGTILERYKSFTLRNGGNDVNFSKIRDPYITAVAEGLRMETAATRPAIAFINGEYWGMYTLTEEFTDNYIDYHYGISNENVVLFKSGGVQEGVESDGQLYWDMFRYIVDNDMNDPACYAKACEMLDMGSYADYLALTLYIGNQDGIFHNNNWEMWRVRKPEESEHPYADGKWRVMLFDTDYSSGVYTDGKSYGEDDVSGFLQREDAEDWTAQAMIQSLMKSDAFRRELAASMCDVRNLYFEPSRSGAILQDVKAAYLPYGGDTFRRFGPEWIARWTNPDQHFSSKIDTIGTYFRGRYKTFPGLMQKALGLQDYVSVSLRSSDAEKGAIYLNGRDIAITKELETCQFTEYPFTLTAVPAEGKRFVRWETERKDVAFADATAATTTVTAGTSCVITAVFE